MKTGLLKTISVSATLATLSSTVVTQDEKAERITYEDHIQTIMREYCTGCHNQRRSKNGLQLHTYTGILQGGSSGASLVKGDANASLLYQLVTNTREPFMPYEEDKLPDETLELIRQWIDGGAPQTTNDAVAILQKPKAKTFDPSSLTKPECAAAMPVNVRTQPYWWTEKPNTINTIAAAPFAPLVAVSGYRQVVLFNTETLARVGVLNFPEGEIHVIKFSPDGSLLLAGGGHAAERGIVVAWDVVTGERILELGNETDVVLATDISEDHQYVALGGPESVVRVYSTSDASLIHEIDKHTDWITSIAFSPDGILLATGDRSGGMFVWEAYSGREFHTLPPHNGRVTNMVWRLDSLALVSSGEDARIRIFDTESGRERKSWQSHGGVLGLAFDRQGRIASAGRDRFSRLFNENGGQLKQFPKLNDLATAIAVSHNGKRVFTGGWTGEIRAFDTDSGNEIGRLAANPATSWQDAIPLAFNNVSTITAKLEALMLEADKATQNADALNTQAESAKVEAEAAMKVVEDAMTGVNAAETTLLQARSVEKELTDSISRRITEVDKLTQALQLIKTASTQTEAEMIAAIEEWSKLNAALRSATDDATKASLNHQIEVAKRLMDGAIAIAEREVMNAAVAEIALNSASIELKTWRSSTQVEFAKAKEDQTTSQTVLDQHAALQTRADELNTKSIQIIADFNRASQIATTAIQLVKNNVAELSTARDQVRTAKLVWEEKRAAIQAAAGRVE